MVSNSDWVETTVGDVVVESFSGPSPTCDERNTEGEEWGVLKTTCATVERGWDWTKHKVLPRSFWGNERSLIRTGDTVITKAGPRHRVAVPAYVDFVPPRILVSGKMVGLRPNPAAIHPRFLALALSDVRTQTFLDERTTGMAESQVNFENVTLLEAPLFLPPMSEQQAIAEALSDADALVESLSALIAKKRDMKQAAMQRCKTPDRIGVPAALKRLSDVVEVRKGELITSSTSGEGDIPVIAGGKEPAYFTNRFNREGLTITVSASGANAGYVALRSGPLWASDCSTVSATEDFDITFLAAQMLVRQDAVYRMQFGGAQPHVRPNDLASLEICIPSLEDQRRLGRVFMDMDAEIEALVAQREKAELVKQGMMQELLSGRVRLS